MKNVVLLMKLPKQTRKCGGAGGGCEISTAIYHSARLMSLENLCRYVLPNRLSERIITLFVLFIVYTNDFVSVNYDIKIGLLYVCNFIRSVTIMQFVNLVSLLK